MVDGTHHDEGHQKQKLREKKQPLRGNLSCRKWILCILPLQRHPPKLQGQQLKPTLTSTFSSWMKVTLTMWQEMHMSSKELADKSVLNILQPKHVKNAFNEKDERENRLFQLFLLNPL
jgi:hypothetical protein